MSTDADLAKDEEISAIICEGAQRGNLACLRWLYTQFYNQDHLYHLNEQFRKLAIQKEDFINKE